MLDEYFKSIIDCVSGVECKSEAQQIAKYELIEYAENLHNNWNKLKQENKELKEVIEKTREYIKEWQNFPHTNGTTHKELNNLLQILDKYKN